MSAPKHTAGPLDKLADYLTGSIVVTHSMGLELGGVAKAAATQYFALREAFGVSGYMGPAEARAAIAKATGADQ